MMQTELYNQFIDEVDVVLCNIDTTIDEVDVVLCNIDTTIDEVITYDDLIEDQDYAIAELLQVREEYEDYVAMRYRVSDDEEYLALNPED